MNVPEVRARKIVHQSVSVAALKIMLLGVHATRAKVLSAAQRHVEEEEKKDFQRASSSSDALAASSSAAATAAPTDSPAGGATSGSGSALATPLYGTTHRGSLQYRSGTLRSHAPRTFYPDSSTRAPCASRCSTVCSAGQGSTRPVGWRHAGSRLPSWAIECRRFAQLQRHGAARRALGAHPLCAVRVAAAGDGRV